MSDILIVKESVEVKKEVRTVEVPDYAPALKGIDKMRDITANLAKEQTKTVEIMGHSILEQVAVYGQELYNPVIRHHAANNEHQISLYDLKYNCYAWSITPVEYLPNFVLEKLPAGINRAHSMALHYTNNYQQALDIIWTDRGWHIITNKKVDQEAIIINLAQNWKTIKKYMDLKLAQLLNIIQRGVDNKAETIQKQINAVANFEL